MQPITQQMVDDLIRSLLNYYLLVRCGALRDDAVTPQFLEAVKKIDKLGVYAFEY